VKFTDGTAYDAAAVKYNWDRQADPTNASPWAVTFKTLTFRVVDPLTIEITLNTPNSQFPRIVSRQLGFIASPTALQAAGSQDAYNNGRPVGAGPFILQSWVHDNAMTLVRNPSYWNAPRPYLDSLVFRVIADPTQRDAALKSGAGDIAPASTSSFADLSKTFSMLVSPAVTTTGFIMQEGHAPFSDASLRRAMSLAIDVDEYNRVIGQNAYETAHTMFPSNYPYTDSSLSLPKTDLAQAQKLVDDYVNTRINGRDIDFTYSYVSTNALADQAAQLVQTQLQRLNHVHVTLQPLTSGQLVANLVAGNFDAGTFTYSGVDPEPEFTEAVTCNGSRNFYNYCNTMVDQAVAVSRTTLDANARIQALKSVQRALIDDAVFVPLSHGGSMFAAKPNVRDISTFDDGGLLTDRIWLK
jgi:peptide/nickel transport system substrate-binding protein